MKEKLLKIFNKYPEGFMIFAKGKDYSVTDKSALDDECLFASDKTGKESEIYYKDIEYLTVDGKRVTLGGIDKLRESIKSHVRKILKEGKSSFTNDDSEMAPNRLPDEFVRQIIHHADKFTSKKFKYYIWENNLNGSYKNCAALLKELKEYIPKERHKEFLEFVDVLKKRFKID